MLCAGSNTPQPGARVDDSAAAYLRMYLNDTGPDRRIMTVRAAVRHRTTHRTETYGGSYGIIRCLVRCHTVARTSSYGDSYGAVRRLVGSGAATRTVPYDDVPYGGS